MSDRPTRPGRRATGAVAEALPGTRPGARKWPKTTAGLDLHACDPDLRRWLAIRAPDLLADHGKRLSDFGAWVGGPLDAQARRVDRFAPPRLDPVDENGTLQPRLVVDPGYAACHAEAYCRGAIGLCFGERPAPHLLSFIMGYLLGQADVSIHCPVTLTGAVAVVLDRIAPADLRERWLPELTRTDGGALTGATWATERHGGSDVGATTTTAEPDGPGRARLTGLKWFCSNAGADLALATARPAGAPDGPSGLGCYLVPARRDDGSANRLTLRRLKDKLGTRALPTGEIALDRAEAFEVAPPPHGLRAMLAALAYSRVHNAMAAAGIARRAFLEAACWAEHRRAFGAPLVDRPMVRDQLVDLIALADGAAGLALEAAAAYDPALADPAAGPWLRTVTALAKFDTAEAATLAARRAVELVGGNGYTEEWPTARLYRDSLVTAVWEGPANIQALELARVVLGDGRGDRSFLARIETGLAHLPEPLADLAPVLAAAHDACAEALATLRARPATAEGAAFRLMRLMADSLVAVLAVERAAADLGAGDRRKELIARRIVALRLGGRRAVDAADPVVDDAILFDAVFHQAEVPA